MCAQYLEERRKVKRSQVVPADVQFYETTGLLEQVYNESKQ